MIPYLIRRTKEYRYGIIFFLLTFLILAYFAYQREFEFLVLYFALQLLFLIILVARASTSALATIDKEYLVLLNDSLDPQALLDKYQEDQKFQNMSDVMLNKAFCYYLLGDFSNAIQLTLEVVSKEKNTNNLIIAWLNLSAFYEANQEFDRSINAYQKACQLRDHIKEKGKAANLQKRFSSGIERRAKAIAYLQHTITHEDYVESIRECLVKEELVKRVRMQLRYILAQLYLEHGEIEKAKVEARYLEELAQKTYYNAEIKQRIQKITQSQESTGDLL